MLRKFKLLNARYNTKFLLNHTEAEIPKPKGLPIVGTTLSLISAGSAAKLHEYIHRRHQELGPIFQDKIGPTSAVFISNPKDIRTLFANEGKYPTHVLPDAWILYNKLHGCSRGLFFMDGEDWLRNRTTMNKLLLKGDLQWIEDACQTPAKDLTKRFVETKGEYITNLEEKLYRWSFETIVSILLGRKFYNSEKDKIAKDLEGISSNVCMIFEHTSKLSLIPSNIAYSLNLPVWKKFETSVTEALVKTKILVETLLRKYPNNKGLLSKMAEEDLQPEIITRIVIDMILAAGDTTAYSMEWLLYLIAKHQNIQEELNESIKLDAQPLLLKNIIKEGLRLYPVAPFLTRFLPQDTVISGYLIPKGSLVIPSIYTTGRDPEIFEDPEEFRPDRWLRSTHGKSNVNMSQAAVPFAIGTRSCIGKYIAKSQILTTLRELVARYRIEMMNEDDVEMVLKMVAVPSEEIKLRVIPRNLSR